MKTKIVFYLFLLCKINLYSQTNNIVDKIIDFSFQGQQIDNYIAMNLANEYLVIIREKDLYKEMLFQQRADSIFYLGVKNIVKTEEKSSVDLLINHYKTEECTINNNYQKYLNIYTCHEHIINYYKIPYISYSGSENLKSDCIDLKLVVNILNIYNKTNSIFYNANPSFVAKVEN